ncbi:MAG: FUSC family protein [Flavobacteriales bacterium]|nr:MAG: FUSC family protein [Flavobacteriales bacterium]
MQYKGQIQKFISSQYVFSGIRITLAAVIPSLILAYFGLLKDYFLFPLATSFAGLTDITGPYIRRRNSLIMTIFSFSFVVFVACLVKDYPPLIYFEIIVFTLFFAMIGVYGQRMATVGGLTLVVFSIFVQGSLDPTSSILKNVLLVGAGAFWFLVVFMVLMKLQPYKLPSQIIGENYLELSKYLKLRAQLFSPNANRNEILKKIIAHQVVIKNLQEESREVVFKTRTIVKESTTQSRLLMLMFLNAIDLYEQLLTSNQNYTKLHQRFGDNDILPKISEYLVYLSKEIENIGIGLQAGKKRKPIKNIHQELEQLYNAYFQLRKEKISPENLEDLMSLRLILSRIKDTTKAIETIYKYLNQDTKIAKSLSTGLDYEKFAPHQEKLNFKVFINNFSLKSAHFRYAIRMSFAMVLGYAISQLDFLGIGHSYWILITIVAIMRPAYSVTKHRNILRVYGTISGAILAYLILTYIHHPIILLLITSLSMILCFSFIKGKYAWAVFFMTIYIFITFNYLQPNSVNELFFDRLIDTFVAGSVIFIASYFVLPVWEKQIIWSLMKKSLLANQAYFEISIRRNEQEKPSVLDYKLRRKDAIIHLANMSDAFQRMLSNPKIAEEKMRTIHQFVNTSHLITAYIASLAQYFENERTFPEIDFHFWHQKINSEMNKTIALLEDKMDEVDSEETKEHHQSIVHQLIEKRKTEIENEKFVDFRDINQTMYLTELKNIQNLLELIFDVSLEQRKSFTPFTL